MTGKAEIALIVGAGPGLSASLARLLVNEGMRVALAARSTGKLAALAQETGALVEACDAGEPADVNKLFETVERTLGAPSLVVYNASGRYRAPITEVEPDRLAGAVRVSALGGFFVAQAAARSMLKQGGGTILLTGATASIKGLPGSTPFAMGKFALRGMAQCFARELGPQNIHVAHFVIDGAIASEARPTGADAASDSQLSPEAIAREYLNVHRQHRSAWTWEVELRPWVERF